MKIIFIGDSITDAGRNREDYHEMGPGYPKYAAEQIKAECPGIEFEFINKGIGGTRTSQLCDRVYNDAIKFNPDIVSVLIGVNDIWHRYGGSRILTTDAQLELNYRTLLERLRRETHAKIVIMMPFLLDKLPHEAMREDLEKAKPIIRKLAEEYADVFIPLDTYFDEALKTQPEPLYYSADGVHPNENGRAFIGKHYAEAVLPIIKGL